MSQVLFAGGRLGSVVNVVGSVTDNTTSGWFNGTYADAGLNVNGVASCDTLLYNASMVASDMPSGHTYYIHFDAYNDFFGGGGVPLTLYDNAGHPWLEIYGDTATTGLYIRYNSGTGASPVWTNLGAVTGTAHHTLQTWDLSVYIDPAGTAHNATLYLNNIVVSGTGGNFSAAGFADFAKVTWSNVNSSRSSTFSQILITQDIPTIGAFVKYSRATAAGNYSAWTGAYTNVNQTGDNTGTGDQATAAALNQSYPVGNVTVPVGYNIATVFYWLRAKNTGGSPGNIKPLLRKGSTDYIGASNLTGIGLGLAAIGTRYDTDPATAAAWTQAGWNTPVQLGYQSEA